MTTKQYPAVEGLFTFPDDEPRLIGSRCESCGTVGFPSSSRMHRPNCPGEPVKDLLLSRRGTLVSWTVQRYPPPPPYRASDPFEPFGLGTVAFAEGIQVAGQMTGCDLADLAVGIEVEVVVDTLYLDAEGNEALTWKFAPVGEGGD